MRILIRTSKWAIWARRIASFAVPLVILPVIMHRERMIDSQTFHLVEAGAAVIATLGLVASGIAIARLWFTGDRGWGKAVLGLLFSVVCLAPFAYVTYEAIRYPRVLDVATNEQVPLDLIIATAQPAPSVDELLAVEAAFPNLKTRFYPLNVLQTYEIVNGLVAERSWDVRARRDPTSVVGTGQINALASTLFGWRDELVLRVAGSGSGTTVDMRSASLSSIHDLGANGQRIEEFLVALDTAVTLLMRDNPAAVQPLDGSTEGPAPEGGDLTEDAEG